MQQQCSLTVEFDWEPVLVLLPLVVRAIDDGLLSEREATRLLADELISHIRIVDDLYGKQHRI